MIRKSIYGVICILMFLGAGCNNQSDDPGSIDYVATSPENFSVTTTKPDRISLAWSENSDIFYYNIYRSPNTALQNSMGLIGSSFPSEYDDFDVFPGLDYSYYVVGVNIYLKEGDESSHYEGRITSDSVGFGPNTHNFNDANIGNKVQWFSFDANVGNSYNISWTRSSANVGITLSAYNSGTYEVYPGLSEVSDENITSTITANDMRLYLKAAIDAKELNESFSINISNP